MDEASLCDRVSLFYKGRLLLSGKPDDINNQFAETIYSIRSSNMYELLSRVREFSGCRSAHLFGQTAHVILKHNYGKKNLDEYLKKQSLNFSINRVEAGIEDVFLKSIEN
jgi:ABC-type multidrug transport system ATPase subunit